MISKLLSKIRGNNHNNDKDAVVEKILQDPYIKDRLIQRLQKEASLSVGRRAMIMGAIGGVLGSSLLGEAVKPVDADLLLTDTPPEVRVSDDGVSWYSPYAPFASAVVYKTDTKVIAKVWSEQRERWKRIAQGKEGVKDAWVIQSAIDIVASLGGGFILLKDSFYIGSNKLTVPNCITLVGYGFFDYSSETLHGSGIIADIAGTAIELQESSRIVGLAVINKNSDGVAIESKGGNVRIFNADIVARKFGVLGNPDTVKSELIVQNCRITCYVGGAYVNPAPTGSVGIYSINNSDCEINSNTIRGFETAIRLERSGNRVIGNHTYRYPAKSIKKSLVITTERQQIISNYFEGLPTEAGIELTGGMNIVISDNLIYVENTAPAIHVNLPTAGWLVNVVIVNNILRTNTGNTNPAVKLVNVTQLAWGSRIKNAVYKFDIANNSESSGSTSLTGDGTSTTLSVTVQHGLVSDKFVARATVYDDTVTSVVCIPVDTDNDGFKESIKIVATFSVAPASGATIPVYWKAEVVS